MKLRQLSGIKAVTAWWACVTWQVVVDRWEMTVTTGKGRSEKNKVTTFNNYFGIGVDAQVRIPATQP